MAEHVLNHKALNRSGSAAMLCFTVENYVVGLEAMATILLQPFLILLHRTLPRKPMMSLMKREAKIAVWLLETMF